MFCLLLTAYGLQIIIIHCLIIEIPTETEVQTCRTGGVIRSPEVAIRTGVEVVVLYVEPDFLQVEVGIDTDDWKVSYLDYMVRILVAEHAESRRVSGGVVFGEVFQIDSELCVQHLGYAEVKIEIVVCGQYG